MNLKIFITFTLLPTEADSHTLMRNARHHGVRAVSSGCECELRTFPGPKRAGLFPMTLLLGSAIFTCYLTGGGIPTWLCLKVVFFASAEENSVRIVWKNGLKGVGFEGREG